VIYVIKCGRL